MTVSNQGLFEAPTSYEANQYGNQEMEYEWGNSHQEFENEWENQEAAVGSQYEFENEWENQEASVGSQYEFENEWEMHEAANHNNSYSNPEVTNEWESPNPYSQFSANQEFEEEGEYFFKSKVFKSIAKKALPLAKRFGPRIVQSLVSMVPGVGAIAAPLAGSLTRAMLSEGEMEAAHLEAQLFGSNEFEAEVGNHEVAQEAALAEFLASQAAESTMEAESAITATLPITVRILGGQRALRAVMPTMTQVTSRRSQLLAQQGSVGKQLLRAVPTMDRIAVSTLKAAARNGQPINSATAVKAMAAATQQVLNNPQKLQKAIAQNLSLRQKTAAPSSARQPYNSRRAAVQARCANCGSQARR
jgi:hypothetical protein